MVLIGSYYIQIKEVHIKWGELRNTSTRTKRKEESYIAIPASYAYMYKILKGVVYQCEWDNGQKCELKAAGSQTKREYAKQFQGNGSLRIVYDWYMFHQAKAGDYVVVNVYDNNFLKIEYVSNEDNIRKEKLKLFGEKGKTRVQDYFSYSTGMFRLKSLIVKEGEEEYCNLCFFVDKMSDVVDEPVVSLIIGANGSGKSFVLKTLADIFYALQSSNVLSQLKYSYYELNYFFNGDLIEIHIINKQVMIHRNGILIEIGERILNKVLAVSFMLNDKFPFKQVNEEDSLYEYLGVRMTSNAAWTSSMSAKLVDSLLNLAEKDRIWKFFEQLSRFLQVDSKLRISYEIPSTIFFSTDLLTDLKEKGDKIILQDDYRSDAIKKIDSETYQMLCEMLINIRDSEKYVKVNNKVLLGFDIDINTSRNEIHKVKNDYLRLKILSLLKIASNQTLYLFKNGVRYSFEESSSGEKHILYSFTNIYNAIKENTLVLIDEPEISLHPNWQIKYISFLKDVFKDYKSCHFVIASHSHYMVSDLKPESSSLIIAKVDGIGKKNYELIDYSTYAWSSENILYNVFEVRTCRNYYFDTEVRELLYMISYNKKEKLERIKYLYEKMRGYILDDNDPLKKVIERAGDYIRDVEIKH